MRILVCGGRNFGVTMDEYKIIARKLNEIAIERSQYYISGGNWLPTDIEIISGMAKGVDTCAVDWAVVNWCKWHEFPANWEDLSHPDAVIRTRKDGTKYDALAGHRRNQKMIDEGKPDLVVAFPGGTGTADMVKRAKTAKVEIIKVGAEECQLKAISGML